MENEQEQPIEEVKEEAAPEAVDQVKEEVVEEVAEETPEQESERERNLKAENSRKQAEIERLRQELDLRNVPKVEAETPEEMIRRMSDKELLAYLNSAQYADHHPLIKDVLDERKFDRYQRRKDENRLRLDSELERQRKYPETTNPSHPMAIRMTELMYLHRLDNTPSGRLVAAELAHAETLKAKSLAAGRKVEQNRQADVKANFQGAPSRPAPKVGDKVKLDELKKKAQSGDETARKEWFRLKGLI